MPQYTPPVDLSGLALTVAEEGTPLATAATTLDFTGAGVTATGSGATKTIDIPGGGGGGLTNFTETLHTSSPNNTVNATQLEVTTGTTNNDWVATPKGTGAFIVGPEPDGTATGGNKRGAYAVDLQTDRGAASRVASGQSSFVAGSDSTASGTYSVAIGRVNNVSGANSFAAVNNNTVAGTSSVGIGNSNTVAGSDSGAFGDNNSCSVTNSFAVGNDNTVSGTISTALGDNNTCSATRSFAFGSFNTSAGAASFAYGLRAHARYPGVHTWSSGGTVDSSTGLGRAQRGLFLPYVETTDATPTEMLVVGKGGTNRMSIPTNTTYSFFITIMGVSTSGTHQASFTRKGMIRNNSGTTALVCTVHSVGSDMGTNLDGPPTGWDVEITADNTNDALKITVTGAAATTIGWTADVQFLENYRA